MPGSLSEHLLQGYAGSMYRDDLSFGQSQDPPSLVVHGPTSYNAGMHGGLIRPPTEISESTAAKIASLQVKLNQKLGPEYVSQRPGPGGGAKLTYIEGWKVINLANEIFGFNGWSSSVINLTTDFVDFNEESRRYNVGVTALIRVTLRDGVFHEDVGYGMLENSKSKGAALDKCKKEAITDGLKRALRGFGNLLGNCLYDKSYTQEVSKMKVAPPKFDQNELHRRPEFQTKRESGQPSTSTASNSHPQPVNRNQQPSKPPVKSEPHHQQSTVNTPQNQNKPAPQRAAPTNGNPPNGQGNSAHSGLPIPYTTPAQRQAALPPHNRPPQPPLIKPPQPPQKYQQAPQKIPQPDTSAAPQNRPPDPQSSSTSRHVAFAAENHTIGDADDSFGCFSDDDAFFATVDLGDCDLGQPIDFEEGAHGEDEIDEEMVGAPDIDHDQNQNQQENMFAMPERVQQPTTTARNVENMGQQRHPTPAIDRLLMAPPHRTSLAPAQHAAGPKPGQMAHAQANGGPSLAVRQQNDGKGTAGGASASVAPGHSGLQKRTTSSGGFNFPPNMATKPRPLQAADNRATPQMDGATSVASGMKRNADAMQMGQMSRKPMQGMGLAQQQARCEVRNPADIGNEGGAKRMRR